jgi:hypothetical protein
MHVPPISTLSISLLSNINYENLHDLEHIIPSNVLIPV